MDQRPVNTRHSTEFQPSVLISICTEQKALCALLMGNPFPCWIQTSRYQTTGCSFLSNIKQACQAPNLPARLERFSLQSFCKAHLFSVNVFVGNSFSFSFFLPYEVLNNDTVSRNYSFPFNKTARTPWLLVSFRG